MILSTVGEEMVIPKNIVVYSDGTGQDGGARPTLAFPVWVGLNYRFLLG
jgi:hypothetical protein